MQTLIDSLLEQINSKKFRAYLAIVVSILAADKEPGFLAMTAFTIEALVTATIGYMGSQGIADHGKSTAKIVAEAEAARTPQ